MPSAPLELAARARAIVVDRAAVGLAVAAGAALERRAPLCRAQQAPAVAVAHDQAGLLPHHRIADRDADCVVRLAAASAARETVHRRLPLLAGAQAALHALAVADLTRGLPAALDRRASTADVAPRARAAGLVRGTEPEPER